MNNVQCPYCGASISPELTECRYCGSPIRPQPEMRNRPNAPYASYPGGPQAAPIYDSDKDKIVAGILGIFLGGLGIHKFYLGHIGMGILYILFCWTFIPALVGFIEGIIYLTSSDETFYRKYVKK